MIAVSFLLTITYIFSLSHTINKYNSLKSIKYANHISIFLGFFRVLNYENKDLKNN